MIGHNVGRSDPLPHFGLTLVSAVVGPVDLLQQALHLKDVLLHEAEAIAYAALRQPLQDRIDTPAHIFLFAGLLGLNQLQPAVYPHFDCFLLVVLVPLGLRAEEDQALFGPEEAVLFGEEGEGVDEGAAEAVARGALAVPEILFELHGLVFDEYLVAVGVGGAAVVGILCEVDEFDDVGVVDVGPGHELGVAEDHLFLGVVFEAVLVDEFVGDCVAVGVVIDFEPVLDHEAGFLLQTVPHRVNYDLLIIIIKYISHDR